MKLTRIILPAMAILGLSLAYCSPEKPDDSAEAPLTGDCTFSYNPEKTSVNWTAFKFTEKAAVGGGFNTFTISGTETADSQLAVFQNATFSIETTSVDSGNDGRDEKIRQEFFGNLEGKTITGSVKSIEGNKGTIIMIMNGEEQEVPVELAVDGRKVTLTGAINVNNWDASGPLAALNKVCEALHTGADKVSKLWPDVDIKVETSLKADCK